MARYYTDPTTGERVEIKKTHRFRNFVVLPAVGLLTVGIVVAAASGGGESSSTATPANVTPAPAETTEASPSAPVPSGATFEAFGDGQAMVTVSTQGTASSTVELPHSQDLPEGYASVMVSRSPDVESYMNGGPKTGEVGCRIIRDGEVVDEQTANGEYASVSCSKFR